jgi:hypothetical protein
MNEKKLVVVSIPLTLIDYPPEYQRTLSESRSKKMAEAFDPVACGTLLVSKRDGRYVVVDGNHRLTALKALGIEEWPCVVMHQADISDEAGLFVKVNKDRIRPTSLDLFKARLAEGDPVVRGIVDVCDTLGVALGGGGNHSAQPMRSRAVSSLERVYMMGGPMLLAEVIRVCTKAWPEEPRHLDGDLVIGVAAFLTYYRGHANFDRQRAIEKFSARPLLALRQRAATLGNRGNGNTYRHDGGGLAGAPGWVKTLVEAYNIKLQSKKLEEPTLSGWKKLNQQQKAESAA